MPREEQEFDFIDIYKRNKFLIKDASEDIWFSLEELADHKHFEIPFVIITAWNPMNTTLPDDENKIRNKQLEENLKALHYNYKPTIGRLGEHSEESFMIYAITLEDALTIATFYEQYSIFYNDSKQLSYIECKNKKTLLSQKVL